MKKALVLHAWEETSKGCWYPWLEKELESRGYEVFVPDLPSTEYPVFQEQFNFVEKFASQMKEGDLVVGHSSGGTLSASVVERLGVQGIHVVLIAPTYNYLANELGKEMLGKYYETMEAYYNVPLSFKTLHNSYTIFLSDNDPYINMKSAKKYYDNLLSSNGNSLEYKEFHNMYHFSDGGPDPVKKVPEILEYI